MASEIDEIESTSAISSLSCQLQDCSISSRFTPVNVSPSNPSNDDDLTPQEDGKTYLRGDRMPILRGKEKKGWFWNNGEEIYSSFHKTTRPQRFRSISTPS